MYDAMEESLQHSAKIAVLLRSNVTAHAEDIPGMLFGLEPVPQLGWFAIVRKACMLRVGRYFVWYGEIAFRFCFWAEELWTLDATGNPKFCCGREEGSTPKDREDDGMAVARQNSDHVDAYIICF